MASRTIWLYEGESVRD